MRPCTWIRRGPAADASVYLWDPTFTPVANGTTDSAGAFVLTDVPAGDYTISFTLACQLTQYAYQQTDPNAAATITVAGDDVLSVEESVIPHGGLAGHVTRSDGSAVPHPYVLAQNLTSGVYVQVNGDADSGYSMPYVPARVVRGLVPQRLLQPGGVRAPEDPA